MAHYDLRLSLLLLVLLTSALNSVPVAHAASGFTEVLLVTEATTTDVVSIEAEVRLALPAARFSRMLELNDGNNGFVFRFPTLTDARQMEELVNCPALRPASMHRFHPVQALCGPEGEEGYFDYKLTGYESWVAAIAAIAAFLMFGGLGVLLGRWIERRRAAVVSCPCSTW
eukprot:PhM_4_TR11328/c1_g1_i2/m.51739